MIGNGVGIMIVHLEKVETLIEQGPNIYSSASFFYAKWQKCSLLYPLSALEWPHVFVLMKDVVVIAHSSLCMFACQFACSWTCFSRPTSFSVQISLSERRTYLISVWGTVIAALVFWVESVRELHTMLMLLMCACFLGHASQKWWLLFQLRNVAFEILMLHCKPGIDFTSACYSRPRCNGLHASLCTWVSAMLCIPHLHVATCDNFQLLCAWENLHIKVNVKCVLCCSHFKVSTV